MSRSDIPVSAVALYDILYNRAHNSAHSAVEPAMNQVLTYLPLDLDPKITVDADLPPIALRRLLQIITNQVCMVVAENRISLELTRLMAAANALDNSKLHG